MLSQQQIDFYHQNGYLGVEGCSKRIGSGRVAPGHR